MWSVQIEPSASAEIEQAFEWYESRRTGLGAEFLRTIAAARELLEQDPLRFSITRVPFRWVKLRKFPYALHFQIDGQVISVLACLHFRQSPQRWPGL